MIDFRIFGFKMILRIIVASGLLLSAPAMAYIGPGSGISLLGGLWGVLVAIVLAIGAVLIWPIRYMFRRLRRKRGGAVPDESTDLVEPDETEHAPGRSD